MRYVCAPVLPLLGVLLLSLVGSCVVAYAYDPRIDPKAASRAKSASRLSLDITRTLDAADGQRPAASTNTPRQ